MTLGLWEIREVKQALLVFCKENELELDDQGALTAARQLMRFAQQRSATSEQLLHQLYTHNAGLSQEAS
ncbi:hypothetical protein [Agrobacterium pusense]|uniref:hypothetical protein n=1 Tax=Agrobacterium pusense TaxID=648995 RepID=UPI001C6E75FA|nr:hypothetical protein [Agrobacterium pusense]MBW9070157.1 hypothetical protein [Agrobacterium pusense]MBW9085003.1 hypothetical protein [Agrobacterium pusense]MBW9125522.1 hypothetical protein [Agrobacterium pusense]MBW9137937.1 hypothetical protein [Agrobacterium pusense]